MSVIVVFLRPLGLRLFAFSDVASFSKALSDGIKGLEAVKVKGGFMGAEVLNPAQVKALASLPPLPVVRAQLLGVLQAPAGKLVRTLAEPGRRMAFVVKAYSHKAAPAAGEVLPRPEAACAAGDRHMTCPKN